jgi:hypothetical protein
MKIRCEGGILDGKEFDKENPEEVIHQSGMFVIRVHRPYPKRKGERVEERLQVYWEDYDLTITPDGPIYRCRAPWNGHLMIGDERLERSEGGGFDVYMDASGRLHAHPVTA